VRLSEESEVLGGLDLLACNDVGEWEAWLAEHHDTRIGAWLKIATKASGEASVSPTEALEVALCYGWIDSQRRSFDATHFLQKYTPRRSKSSWSKMNTARVDALMAAGRMRAPGIAEISAAKADGRWDAAYEPQRNVTVPPDLAAALAQSEAANHFFESLAKSHRYALILRLLKASSPADRATQLRTVIGLLEAGKRIGRGR
jgi:uncharacterized protein YdeI (YjbR/CyaY-like superfamily)